MANYHFTNKAKEDLTEIWNYTFDEWSEEQADRYYFMLIDSCVTISKNIAFGKSYDFILENFSGFQVGRHIIFYRKMDDVTIEITRILHVSMDLKFRILD